MSFRPPAVAKPSDAPSGKGPKLPGTKKKKDRGIWALVWPFLKPQIAWIVLGVITAGLGTLIAVNAASALQAYVDIAVISREVTLDSAIGRVVFLAVLASILGIPSRLVWGRIIYHLNYKLKTWLYDRLQSIDPRKLDAVASGQLMTRANADLALFEVFLLLFPILLAIVPILLGITGFLFTRSVGLTLLVLAAMPVNIFLAKLMAKPLWGMSWMHLNQMAQVTTVADEAVRGIRTVKAFGREDDERAKLAQAAARAYGVVMKRTKFLARYDVALKVVPALVNMAMFYVASRLIVDGTFTIGALLVFLTFGTRLVDFAQAFDRIVDIYQYVKTASGRIYELIFGEYRGAERGGAPIPDPANGVLFENVSVSYGGNRVIESFDLELRPGEVVVVQGGPGSGKSTIAGLACGLVEATDGTVFVEDWDVQKLHPQKLRREIRVLNEEPFLFGRTLRENLEIGSKGAAGATERPKVEEADVRAAVAAACAEQIVEELPQGLDSALGDRGLTLSGGQRQRIGLARALVAPPRVLVLDDALLAVNPSMEAEILQRIRRHAPETSVLVLTRRVGLEHVADRVVRLPGALLTEFDETSDAGDTLRHDAPYSLALATLVSSLSTDQDTGEKPKIAERAVTESDKPPTVFNLLSPIKVVFGVTSLLVLCATALVLAPGLVFRDVVDAIQAEDLSRVDRDILIGVGIAVGLAVVVFFARIFRFRVQESLIYLLKRRTFQRLTRLGVDFYDRELPGQIATRMTHDTQQIQQFVEDGPYRLVNAALLVIGAVIILFSFNPGIGVIALLFLPVLVGISAVGFPLLDRINRIVRREVGNTNERLQEDFIGRYAIHTYGTQAWARSAFDAQARKVRNAYRTQVGIGALFSEAFELVLALAGAALLLRAGHLVTRGVLTTGTMTAMHGYVQLAFGPLGLIAVVIGQYITARASFLKIRELYTVPILPAERPNARECPELDGRLVLDGVSFKYPGTARTVLENVSLAIAPGQVVALVGPTGAGKSSVAKLVARIYDPDEGSVSVDGVDLREIRSDSYRRRLGIVPQEVFCFRGTVLSNVSYGEPRATVAEVEAAAQEMGVLESLRSIPGQWSGMVDEEGRNITAAQRQMIGIVRAWLSDPDVMILDEATATLSEELEREVLEAVEASDRTTVFITHRLAVARSADLVAVIDEGRVVEFGPHDVLARSGGPYARLWAFGPEVTERAMAAATGRRVRRAPAAKPADAVPAPARRTAARRAALPGKAPTDAVPAARRKAVAGRTQPRAGVAGTTEPADNGAKRRAPVKRTADATEPANGRRARVAPSDGGSAAEPPAPRRVIRTADGKVKVVRKVAPGAKPARRPASDVKPERAAPVRRATPPARRGS